MTGPVKLTVQDHIATVVMDRPMLSGWVGSGEASFPLTALILPL